MPRHIPNRVLIGIVLFWTGSMCTDLLSMRLDPDLETDAVDWSFVLAKRALLSAYWIVMTVVSFEAMHGRIGVQTRCRIVTRAAALSMVIAVGMVAWFGMIMHLLSGGENQWSDAPRMLGWISVLSLYLTTCGVVLAAIAFDYYQRTTQREREAERLRLRLAQSELTVLRGQLEPHFLFNSLNSIAALVRLQRTRDAVDALARLADLLRGSLEVGQRTHVSWAWERRFTETYVALQAVRFGARLAVRFDTDLPEDTRVPPLLLQPLIENAIRHGPLAEGQRCEIDVTARCERGEVEVRVCNAVARAPTGAGNGVGLANLVQRIERLYGGVARCESGVFDDARFHVIVRFPFVAGEEVHA